MLIRRYMISRGLNYLRRNGLKSFFFKVMEKLEQSKKLKYDYYQDNPCTSAILERQRKHQFKYEPLISIVVPVYNTNENFLIEMINSVLNQTYSNFELCIFNGGSNNPKLDSLIRGYADKDKRIVYKCSNLNEGISNNTNSAIALAKGKYIGLLDHDDLLSPNALYECVKVINKFDPDIIYSDEDKISEDSSLHLEPHKKPDWSPDTLLSYNYICHFLVFKSSLLNETGLFKSEFDGSQDYEFILRLTSVSKKIYHIPKVLYHWRINSSSTASNIYFKKHALEAGKKSLEEFLYERKIVATVSESDFIGSYKISYQADMDEYVTLIIVGAWRKKEEILKKYNLIKTNTEWTNVKFIFLNKADSNNQYNLDSNCMVFGVNEQKYSSYINEAIRNSSTELIFIMDSEIQLTRRDWCYKMVGESLHDHIAIVAPKILKNKIAISNFGLIVTNSEIKNISENVNKNYFGYIGRNKISQNVTAVSPQFLLIKKSILNVTGFLDEVYESPIAIIDLCIKVNMHKKYVKIIPDELVIANENNLSHYQDLLYFRQKHMSYLKDNDKFYPNKLF
ncbi:hypothetical protein PAE9249_04903 [Paenibacillus sp. CECT 9249]|nr:hypothetical protein PAE9249_04903 [Paenibacillus sp. CECT 9249]